MLYSLLIKHDVEKPFRHVFMVRQIDICEVINVHLNVNYYASQIFATKAFFYCSYYSIASIIRGVSLSVLQLIATFKSVKVFKYIVFVVIRLLENGHGLCQLCARCKLCGIIIRRNARHKEISSSASLGSVSVECLFFQT